MEMRTPKTWPLKDVMYGRYHVLALISPKKICCSPDISRIHDIHGKNGSPYERANRKQLNPKMENGPVAPTITRGEPLIREKIVPHNAVVTSTSKTPYEPSKLFERYSPNDIAGPTDVRNISRAELNTFRWSPLRQSCP